MQAVAAAGGEHERTVSAALVHILLMFGVKRGLDPDSLCAAAGFHSADIADRDRQVPCVWLLAIFRALEADDLIADVTRFAVLEELGYLGRALKHAATPLEALCLLAKYGRLVDSALHLHPLVIEQVDDAVHVIAPDVHAAQPEWAQALLLGALAVVRALSPCEITPRALQLKAAAPARLVLDAAPLEQPTRAADANSAQHFRAQVDKLMAQQDDPFVTLVHRAIAAQLVRGNLSQQRVGRCLALSQRSLQRKLNQHGLKYSTLVHEMRKHVAARLLLDPERSVADVASALGYQDVSSFARVFRRWTGISPTRYRHERRAQPSLTRAT